MKKIPCPRSLCFDGLRCRSDGAPEIELGLAAGLKAGKDLAAGVIPEEQLLTGGIVVAGVEIAEERGRGEAALAEVVTEIDERIKLTLGKGNMNEVLDVEASGAGVGGEKFLGLGFVDAIGIGLAGEELVAVADGGQAGRVVVGGGAEAFEFFDQVQSGIVEMHTFSRDSELAG